MSQGSENGARIVAKSEMAAFMVRVMTAVGVSEEHAASLADCLVTGDYRGHYSHGLNRLELYIKDVQQGSCKGTGSPVILNQTAASAWVDGQGLLGPVIGRFCMKLAIEKAKTAGIALVTAKGGNHFGIAGYYSTMALEENLIGMAFTNASPLVSATRGKEPFFGTNPISVAAPGAAKGDNFVLDMATSVVALGKIELAARKEQPIPHGWAVDKEGASISDPNQYHALLPLGGPEASSGYKGYGLAAVVEILTGVLSGAAVAPHIRHWTSNSAIADLGHCFIAINPALFAPGFNGRLQTMMDDLRSQETSGEQPVLVAGDPERQHMAKCDRAGGIEYHANQIKMANEIASRLKVAPVKTL